jgi:hypothetical protein
MERSFCKKVVAWLVQVEVFVRRGFHNGGLRIKFSEVEGLVCEEM